MLNMVGKWERPKWNRNEYLSPKQLQLGHPILEVATRHHTSPSSALIHAFNYPTISGEKNEAVSV